MASHSLLYKFVIGLACLAAAVALVSIPRVRTMPRKRFDGWLAAAWAVTRLGLFTLAFLVLGMHVRSDVPTAYFPQGNRALGGGLVYRDFVSVYAPAFPYLMAGVLAVWNSAKAIVLSTIVMDGLGFLVWLRVARRLWSEWVCRKFALFYVFGSLGLLDVAIAGQNQAWVALLLGLAVLFYLKGNRTASSVLAGLPVVLVKFLSLLYLPAFLRRGERPVRVLLLALAVPVAAYATLYAAGSDILVPVRQQGSLVTCGTVPYLLSGVLHYDGGWLGLAVQLVAAGVLGALALYFITRRASLNAEQILWSMVMLTLTCALVNKKFYTSYLVMVFAPICAMAATEAVSWISALKFGAFNLVAALEPSLWLGWLRADESHSLLYELMPRLRAAGHAGRVWAFVGVDVVLVLFYAYYLMTAFRLFKASMDGAGLPGAEKPGDPAGK